ncbi:MAG: hypothetical protein EOM59_06600 [Clostridia bacterium]|nr:hypothetical protein [Clostridia bacterium]
MSHGDFPIILLASILFTGGVILLVWRGLRDWQGLISAEMGRRRKSRKEKAEAKPESRLDRSIRYLLETAWGGRISVSLFKNISALLFLFFFIFGSAIFNYSTGLVMAAAAGTAPFLLLRVKLEKERSHASFEAEQLVVSILNKYRISHFNVEEAMEAVIEDVPDLPLTRKMLFQLLIRMRTTKNKEEIRDAAGIFAYNIGTNWAKMLANNIFQAQSKGMNVVVSLEDILSQLREARVLAEERKRNNLESVILVKLFCPGAYLIFSYFAIDKFDLGFTGFLYNQFLTKQGLILFFYFLLLFFTGYLLLELVQNKKFDF